MTNAEKFKAAQKLVGKLGVEEACKKVKLNTNTYAYHKRKAAKPEAVSLWEPAAPVLASEIEATQEPRSEHLASSKPTSEFTIIVKVGGHPVEIRGPRSAVLEAASHLP